MGTKTQNQDLDTTWKIETSNDTYILGENAQIDTTTEYGMEVAADANNDTVILKGDITTTNSARAVSVLGNNIHLQVAKTSHIDASDFGMGIAAEGIGFTMSNAGRIEAKSAAISVGDYAGIVNTGTVFGDQIGVFATEGLHLANSGTIDSNVYGVLASAEGAVIGNLEGGTIKGISAAISLTGEGTALIRNSGLLMGQNVAINDGAADTTVINKGTISGDVYLGAGDDVFNTRAGKFAGTVNGGNGDDTYIVGKSNTQIEEQPGFGYDKVKSTASFTMSDNLEDLILQGKKDIDGTGNDAHNVLTGNSGDNVLKGMGGDDYLKGGKGNDSLFGGADQDMFDFRKGGGDDVVEDFVNGEDLIFATFANNGPEIADLIENHAVAKNGGVLITYGDATLFIKGMSLNQLDESDFFQGL